jgi:hypothetical protein
MTCQICSHPKRDAIDAALRSGESDQKISARYQLQPIEITRHRAPHLSRSWSSSLQGQTRQQPPTLVAAPMAAEIADVAETVRLMTRIAEVEADTARMRNEAARVSGPVLTTAPSVRQDAGPTRAEVDELLSLTAAGRETLAWRAQREETPPAAHTVDPEIRALMESSPAGRLAAWREERDRWRGPTERR